MTKPVDIVSFFCAILIRDSLVGAATILIAANSCYRRNGADPKLAIKLPKEFNDCELIEDKSSSPWISNES